MAHGVVILECPTTPQSEVWARSYGVLSGVELVLRLHQEYPGVVKLVMELHHVSQGGNQGEFRDGGASVSASPCEFR